MVELHRRLNEDGIFERIIERKKQAKGIQKSLSNYIDQVETLLMFTAATRKADWKLQSPSLKKHCLIFMYMTNITVEDGSSLRYAGIIGDR